VFDLYVMCRLPPMSFPSGRRGCLPPRDFPGGGWGDVRPPRASAACPRLCKFTKRCVLALFSTPGTLPTPWRHDMGNKPLMHEAIEQQSSLIDRLCDPELISNCRACPRPLHTAFALGVRSSNKVRWSTASCVGGVSPRSCLHGLGGAPQLAMPGIGV
jgi:hypothetical protein